MRTAVIDLGTNTFNLLIADVSSNSIDFIYKAKMPSKLGEDGINNSQISTDARRRGVHIIKEYQKIIKKHCVQKVHAIATSAVRSAENGQEFVKEIEDATGVVVNVISGIKEAELIYNGVKETIPEQEQNYLILDIGGGSTEFILVKNNKVESLNSLNLGMARLIERFEPSEPITKQEISDINAYLSVELKQLSEELRNANVKTLVGSSGSFDTLLSIIAHQFYAPGHNKKKLSSRFEKEHFDKIYQLIISSTLEERREIPGMDLVRVEMMVLAMIFTKFIIDEFEIAKLMQSRYSLKEGVLFSLEKK